MKLKDKPPIQQQPPQLAQQPLPVIREQIKVKPKVGILKAPSFKTPVLDLDITEFETKPIVKKREKTPQRRVATGKLFKINEVSAQRLDCDTSTTESSSTATLQQPQNTDSVRLTYLKRYVANGLAGKNNAKFINGYWNRLPLKTNVYELAAVNEAASKAYVADVPPSYQTNKFSKPVISLAQQYQQKLQNSTSSLNSAASNNTSPSLPKEVSVIDLNLPSSIKNQQSKTPTSYYKRNFLVYLNKMNNTAENVPKESPSTSISQKSVTFNDKISVESYPLDNQSEEVKTNDETSSKQIFPTHLKTILFDKLQFKYVSSNTQAQTQLQAKLKENLDISGRRFYLINEDSQKNFHKQRFEFNNPTSPTKEAQMRHIKID